MGFLDNKRGQVKTDNIINAVIGVVIVASILAGTASIVLDSFTNLSGAGLALGVLFATVLPLLFAVGVFKAVQKTMRI